MIDPDSQVVFVYGTLKKGYNNSCLLGPSRFLGTAKTVPGYTLYNCGAYPAMVKKEGASGVTGELYEVKTKLIDSTLDRLEGVPFLYVRGKVALAESVGDIKEALCYIYNRDLSERKEVGETWGTK